jgi:hypothetical protein
VISALVLLAIGPTTWYVSPGRTSDDANEGTSVDKPLKSLSKAVEKAGDKDVIKLLDGIYPDQKLEISDRDLTIESVGNANPRLKSLNLSVKGGNLTLSDLEIQGESKLAGVEKSELAGKQLRFLGAVELSGFRFAGLTESRFNRAGVSVSNLGDPKGGKKPPVALTFARCISVDAPGDAFKVQDIRGGVEWQNCLIVRSKAKAISVRSAARAKVDFCTIADIGDFALVVVKCPLTISNSIIKALPGKIRNGGSIASDYNLFAGDPPEADRFGPHDQFGDPKFGLALAGGDLQIYRPLSTSPALRAAAPRDSLAIDLTGTRRSRPADLGCLQVSR